MKEFKQYTIDTNALRYQTNKTGDPELRLAARLFWRNIQEKTAAGEAVVLVPAEVIRELEVQAHTLPPKEYIEMHFLIEKCTETSPPVSLSLEHQLRNMSAYLRAHYQQDLEDVPMSYGGVSDVRILYSAYYEDSVLVTANIKDFILYPFLFAQHEERLYNLKLNKFIQIPEHVYAKVWQDQTFRKMFQELKELELALEDHEE